MIAPRLAASVIVPAYNAAATIGEQLDALARQADAPAFEVLVCDNGSSDATGVIAQDRASAVPRLTVVDASRVRGPAAARNLGARASAGDLLLFCDADDVVDERWVAELCAALGEAALAGGGFEHELLNAAPGSVTWDVNDRIRMPFWPEFTATPTSNLGVRREVFEAIGGFDEALTIGEDVDFCWRAQLAGHSLVHRPTAVVHLRKRAGLRAVFRQARAYGIGGRVLERRYSVIAAAYRPREQAATDASVAAEPTQPPSRGDGSRARRVARRAVAVRRLGDLADPAWRLGEWWGRRIARPRVEPLADPRARP